MQDFVADDFAFIAQRAKEIKREQDAMIGKKEEPTREAPKADPANYGDEVEWAYFG
jgi:hypothetical protein